MLQSTTTACRKFPTSAQSGKAQAPGGREGRKLLRGDSNASSRPAKSVQHKLERATGKVCRREELLGTLDLSCCNEPTGERTWKHREKDNAGRCYNDLS
eukprot:jgi/Chlat1/5518/Chrsp360S05333